MKILKQYKDLQVVYIYEKKAQLFTEHLDKSYLMISGIWIMNYFSKYVNQYCYLKTKQVTIHTNILQTIDDV